LSAKTAGSPYRSNVPIVHATSSTQGSITNIEFQRILLVKPSSLGDVVHALPVLHGLRTRYPKAKIDWLIGTAFAPLLDDHPEIDELVQFDRKRYGRMLTSPSACAGFLRFVRMLRGRRYDLVIDLQGLFRSGFLTRATGSPVRIGFRAAREGAKMFYTHHLVADDPNMHAVDRNYLVASLLGFTDVPISFPLPLSEKTTTSAARILTDCGVDASNAYIVIAPGARGETKVWPAARFIETIDALRPRTNLPCVLVGGSDEFQLCEGIRTSCGSPVINLAGQTSLPQLAAILANARGVLCHDSAVAHLAAAFDRPLVCITGPTNPLRTGPYRRISDVVQLELDCAPCYLRKLSDCTHNHRCMRELGSEQVISALAAAVERDNNASLA